MVNPLRIYVDGVFDLTHYGHYALFKKIKQVYPLSILIVGIASDKDCNKYKYKPIFTQEERAHSVSYCKYVDVILDNIPWIIDENFILKHGIDYICHDPRAYPSENVPDIYRKWKDKGIFIGINRSEGISSSSIINRIKTQHQIQSPR